MKRALFIYFLIAVALFSSTWIDPAGSLIGTPKDPKLFVWYLGWLPHELSLGQAVWIGRASCRERVSECV